MKLMKFYATWCNPCVEQGKILDCILVDYPIDILSVDVDDVENTELVFKYNIEKIPYLILFDSENNILWEKKGFTTKEELISILEKYDKK